MITGGTRQIEVGNGGVSSRGRRCSAANRCDLGATATQQSPRDAPAKFADLCGGLGAGTCLLAPCAPRPTASARETGGRQQLMERDQKDPARFLSAVAAQDEVMERQFVSRGSGNAGHESIALSWISCQGPHPLEAKPVGQSMREKGVRAVRHQRVGFGGRELCARTAGSPGWLRRGMAGKKQPAIRVSGLPLPSEVSVVFASIVLACWSPRSV